MLIFLFSTGTNIRILPRRSSSSSQAVWKLYPKALEYSQNSILGRCSYRANLPDLNHRCIVYFQMIHGKINCSDSVILNGVNYLHIAKCSYGFVGKNMREKENIRKKCSGISNHHMCANRIIFFKF